MKNAKTIFIIATISVITFIIACLLYFGNALSFHKYQDIENRLQEGLKPNTVSFALQMDEQIKKVKTFASFLGENWDGDRKMQVSLLKSAVEHNGLLRCAVALPDGSFFTHDDKNDGDVSNDAFFQANMRGDFFITDPRPAVVDATKTVILFAAPIFDKEQKVIGSVIYSYLCNDLDKIFNLDSMNGAMQMMVVKGNGQVLIDRSKTTDTQSNLVEQLTGNCTHKSHPNKPCFNIMGESGTIMLSLADKNESLYVHYEKLEQNDWYMIGTIAESDASVSLSFTAQNQRQLTIIIASAIMAYSCVIGIMWMLRRKLIDVGSGAPTVHAFRKRSRAIFEARRSPQYVVVKLDIKDFKLINRIYSFATGDKVIKSVAMALKSVLNSVDSTFARVGVDSFVLLLPYEGREELSAKRQVFIESFHNIMQENFCTKILFPTGQYILKPSDYPKPDIKDILEKVNFAHRAAKQNSDLIIDYEEDVESTALFEKRVEDRMEDAIKAEEFTLYLQPKILLRDESLCGVEALVRWKIGDKYYMYPTDFIPVLEKNGFIVQLDLYMFRCAAKFIRQCMDKGITPLPISVNFSRHHLSNSRFVGQLCKIADEFAVPHKYLEIEITESAFLGHTTDIVKLIDKAHEAGFTLSMDDFGSGYSCFAQLKDLNIDVLKIDKEFFSESKDERRTYAVVAGIIRIAQELKITTVAEGVENLAQVARLRELGCDIIQGYYYSKPIPATELDIGNFVVKHEEE